jgi:hypothetical protein
MSDLAERVARLFSPKPWKHGYKFVQAYGKGNIRVGDLFACEKCGQQQRKLDGQTLKNHLCDFPDPIDITDLGKALECFRGLKKGRAVLHSWYIEAYNMAESLDEIIEGYEMSSKWMLYEATAEQIWEICCLAKEASK